MSLSEDDDSQNRFVLGVVGGIVALLLTTVVGIAIHQQGVFKTKLSKAQEQEIAQTVPSLVGDAEAARVTVSEGVVTFYFATSSAALAAGTNEALADIVQGVQSGKRAVVSGFHDPSGDAVMNAALAKERAEAVGKALIDLGVPADRIEYRKPDDSTGTGDAAHARRVEVTLAD